MPNRYDELTKTEQAYMDSYINSVASGGTPEFLQGLYYWLDESESHHLARDEYIHAMAMVRHHLSVIASPDDEKAGGR